MSVPFAEEGLRLQVIGTTFDPPPPAPPLPVVTPLVEVPDAPPVPVVTSLVDVAGAPPVPVVASFTMLADAPPVPLVEAPRASDPACDSPSEIAQPATMSANTMSNATRSLLLDSGGRLGVRLLDRGLLT